MKNIPPRMKLSVAIAFIFAALFFMFSVLQRTEEPSHIRSSAFEQMKQAYVVIPEFDVRVKLVNGVAHIPPDTDYPDAKDVVKLLPNLQAQANAMRSRDTQERNYVFGVATLSGSGNKVFYFLLMFEDDGRKVQFLTARLLGDRVSVSGIAVGLGSRDKALSPNAPLSPEFSTGKFVQKMI